MEYLEEGTNAVIYISQDMVVQKVTKKDGFGHDSLTQKRIHGLLTTLLETDDLFFVPSLCHGNDYCMMYIDTSAPVHLSILPEATVRKFADVWRTMWNYGFGLFGFELYQQTDGRIAIIDFDKTAFRVTDCPLDRQFEFPFEMNTHGDRISTFFAYPCFPPHFLELLVGSSEGDQYLRLAQLPYYESIAQNRTRTRNGRSTVSR